MAWITKNSAAMKIERRDEPYLTSGMKDKLSREILIRSALVEGEVSEDWVKKWRFFQHNARLMHEIETLEHKSRRPDVLVDDVATLRCLVASDRIRPRNGLNFAIEPGRTRAGSEADGGHA